MCGSISLPQSCGCCGHDLQTIGRQQVELTNRTSGRFSAASPCFSVLAVVTTRTLLSGMVVNILGSWMLVMSGCYMLFLVIAGS
jgi:hypothetical protein